MATSGTRNWGNLGWTPLTEGHEIVEIDWFFASASGVRFWSRDGSMKRSHRLYERLANNRAVVSSGDAPANGSSVVFLNGMTQTRGELPYAFFSSGRVTLQARLNNEWHGTYEIFTQSNYIRGTITLLPGVTGFAVTAEKTDVSYGSVTSRGWNA